MKPSVHMLHNESIFSIRLNVYIQREYQIIVDVFDIVVKPRDMHLCLCTNKMLLTLLYM